MLRQMEGNQDQEQALREAFKVRAALAQGCIKPVLHACMQHVLRAEWYRAAM